MQLEDHTLKRSPRRHSPNHQSSARRRDLWVGLEQKRSEVSKTCQCVEPLSDEACFCCLFIIVLPRVRRLCFLDTNSDGEAEIGKDCQEIQNQDDFLSRAFSLDEEGECV